MLLFVEAVVAKKSRSMQRRVPKLMEVGPCPAGFDDRYINPSALLPAKELVLFYEKNTKKKM